MTGVLAPDLLIVISNNYLEVPRQRAAGPGGRILLQKEDPLVQIQRMTEQFLDSARQMSRLSCVACVRLLLDADA